MKLLELYSVGESPVLIKRDSSAYKELNKILSKILKSFSYDEGTDYSLYTVECNTEGIDRKVIQTLPDGIAVINFSKVKQHTMYRGLWVEAEIEEVPLVASIGGDNGLTVVEVTPNREAVVMTYIRISKVKRKYNKKVGLMLYSGIRSSVNVTEWLLNLELGGVCTEGTRVLCTGACIFEFSYKGCEAPKESIPVGVGVHLEAWVDIAVSLTKHYTTEYRDLTESLLCTVTEPMKAEVKKLIGDRR